MASVHPCKHSSVMKKFIERIDKRFQKDRIGRGAGQGEEGEEEEQRGLRVDQYLVVFLKFMSSIGTFPSLLPPFPHSPSFSWPVPPLLSILSLSFSCYGASEG